MKWKIFLLALLWPSPAVLAQTQPQAELKSLEIGDQIPKEIWEQPFKVINHPDGKEIIRLSDYSGKLIILDFWATWCGSCIEYMPKMYRLQVNFDEAVQILPVTYQDSDKIRSFWKGNTILNDLELHSIVEHSSLRWLFPHRMIPHLVWINQEGEYLGATSSYDAKPETVRRLLDDQTVRFASPKRDQLQYNRSKPLFIDGNGSTNEKYLYRSIITPALDGIPVRAGTDTAEGMARIIATNQPVPDLYKLALGISMWWPANRIRFEGIDKQEYVINDWYKEKDKKAFCYELLMPAKRAQESRHIMLQDLNRFFQLNAYVEKRTIPCFVLKKITDQRLSPSAGKERTNNYLSGVSSLKYQQNQPISVLVGALNRLSDSLIVLDETNYDEPIDLALTEDLSDFKALDKALTRYGFKLDKDLREVELLIIAKED